jgi:hypothetical protein
MVCLVIQSSTPLPDTTIGTDMLSISVSIFWVLKQAGEFGIIPFAGEVALTVNN